MSNKPFRLEDLERKQHPFTVPEDYFDNLSYKIQDRLPSRAESKSSFVWNWGRRLAVAGSMMSIVLALLWVTLPNQFQGSLGEEPLALVSDEAIVDYLNAEVLSYESLADNKLVQSSFVSGQEEINYLPEIHDEILEQELLDNTVLDINI